MLIERGGDRQTSRFSEPEDEKTLFDPGAIGRLADVVQRCQAEGREFRSHPGVRAIIHLGLLRLAVRIPAGDKDAAGYPVATEERIELD